MDGPVDVRDILGRKLREHTRLTRESVQALRRTETMEFRKRVLTVLDWDGLQQIGEFDPRYLHLTRRNRI